MTITHAWALRVIYGSLFLSVAVILVIFPPQVWPSRLWKPSCDAVEPPSSSPSPSPSPSPAATAPKAPVWLIATISAAKAFERRNLIRATWQSLYNNPVFETRFVIAEPGEALMHVIEFENKTHGDLIMIRDLEETRHTANRVKTIQFFKQLLRTTNVTEPAGNPHTTSSQERAFPWAFVSKVDDDSFLLPTAFYEEYLRPILDNPDHTNIPPTMIAGLLAPKFEHEISPCGQFYTLTFDLVERLVQQYEKTPYTDVHEDRLVGRLLAEGEVPFGVVELKENRAFDLGVNGVPSPETMEIHQLKDDEKYLNVASIFDENGFNKEEAKKLGLEYGGGEDGDARRWMARQRLRRRGGARC